MFTMDGLWNTLSISFMFPRVNTVEYKLTIYVFFEGHREDLWIEVNNDSHAIYCLVYGVVMHVLTCISVSKECMKVCVSVV